MHVSQTACRSATRIGKIVSTPQNRVESMFVPLRRDRPSAADQDSRDEHDGVLRTRSRGERARFARERRPARAGRHPCTSRSTREPVHRLERCAPCQPCASNADGLPLGVHVMDREADKLGTSHGRRIERLDNGSVTQPERISNIGRGNHLLYLADGQELRASGRDKTATEHEDLHEVGADARRAKSKAQLACRDETPPTGST
jgi:hypothetical protein